MSRRLEVVLPISLSLAGWIASSALAQGTIYVDAAATGANNGTSWCDAFQYLQDALAVAITDDTIQAADGVYKPDRGANQTLGDIFTTFQLVDGVTIEGGYAGCGAADPDFRDVAAHESVLSGDLLGNDATNFPFDLSGRAENCFHVVTANGTNGPAILDGFTITGGWAIAAFHNDSDEWGGRLLNLGGRPTVRHCTFTRNFATLGSSMYNADGARPVVTSCTFVNNRAEGLGDVVNLSATSASFETCTFVGLGIPAPFATGVFGKLSSTTFTDCEFRNFVSACEGGAVWSEDQEVTFLRCVFLENKASRAGAVYLRGPQEALFTDCLFQRNQASGGGAIYMDNSIGSGRITFRRCEFLNNEAGEGGAVTMDVMWENEVVFSDCSFIGNRAVPGVGGGFLSNGSCPAFEGCVFRGNTATDSGGGIYFGGAERSVLFNTLFERNVSTNGHGGGIYIRVSEVALTNCTIVENTASIVENTTMQRLGHPSPSHGGGIFNENNVQTLIKRPTLKNCILWGNRDSGGVDESAQMFSDALHAPIVQYTAIQGLDQWDDIGNIGDDPLFTPGPQGCYYLSQTAAGQAADSPCVDAGNKTAKLLNLSELTTRSDEGADVVTVDMGYHHPVIGQPVIMGDYDRNLSLDLADVAGLQNCFTGVGPTDILPCCRIFDFTADHDIDLDDSASLVTILDGP